MESLGHASTISQSLRILHTEISNNGVIERAVSRALAEPLLTNERQEPLKYRCRLEAELKGRVGTEPRLGSIDTKERPQKPS